jgi:hypothetical protein
MTPEQEAGATSGRPRRLTLELGEDLVEQRGELLEQSAQSAAAASCVVEQVGDRAEKVAEEVPGA